MRGSAEVSAVLSVDGEEMYGQKLDDEIRIRLEDAFDDVDDLDVYLL